MLGYQEIIGQMSGSAKVCRCTTAVRKEVSPDCLCAFPSPQKYDIRLASGISGVALGVRVTLNLPSPLTRAKIQK